MFKERQTPFTLDVRTLVVLAMLTAMEIVLNRFLSINTPILKIGFNFVPVAIAAMLYGPLGGAIVGGLGDYIGAILFPIGQYFPGFTVTAILTGVVLGLFLHKDVESSKWFTLRTAVAVGINNLILSLFLNTYWLYYLYIGTEKAAPYWDILVPRFVQCAILIPVQFAVILAIAPAIHHFKQQLRMV